MLTLLTHERSLKSTHDFLVSVTVALVCPLCCSTSFLVPSLEWDSMYDLLGLGMTEL